jgi:pimeloyl-ACP methyl ester carboxylesterase
VRPSRLTAPRALLAGLALLLVGALGALALYTSAESRRAERAFPAAGAFVTVDGVRLRYRESGTGAAVVLLHGNPGFLEDFAPDDSAGVFAALAHERRVVGFDRPGHGYSDRASTSGTTPREQARLLHGALQQLGVVRPILVGHSWGGGLALVYALQYPDDVGGLVLLGTRAYRDSGAPDPVYAMNRVPVLGALLQHTMMLPLGRWILDRRLASAYAPDAPDASHAARARGLWLRPTQIAATVWDSPNLQAALDAASPRYGSIAVPVTVLVGDGDRGLAESRRLARAIPGATLSVLPHTGHELPLTRPRAIVAAVRDVAGRVRASAVDGAGVHPEHLPMVSVEIVEAPAVHEAMVLGIGSVRTPGGQRLRDHRVHLGAAVHAEREHRVRLAPRIAHRTLAEAGESRVVEQHEVGVLAHEHAGRRRIGELAIEGEAERLEEADRALDVAHRDVDEQLVRRERPSAGVRDGGSGCLSRRHGSGLGGLLRQRDGPSAARTRASRRYRPPQSSTAT